MNRLVFATVVCAAAFSVAADGAKWEMLPIDGGGYVMNVVFTRNPQVAYMTIDVGGPYRSDDGLKTWRPLHGAMPYDMKRNFFTSPRSLSADPRDENSIVVAAGNNARHPAGIIVSRDGGKTWKQTAVGNYLANARRRWMGQLLDRNPWNPDELVTGGDCTGLMKSTDNGETWRPVGNLRDRWFSCIHYDRTVKGRVWACAPGYADVPGEAKSVADGREPNPVPRYGRMRGLYRSDDGGETWTELLPERIPEELCQIAGDPRVVGIFEEQRILASADGGRTWTDFAQGLDKLPTGVNVWDNYGCQRGVYKAIGAGSDFLLVSDTRGNVFRRGKDEDVWREVKAKSQALTHPEREMRDASHKPAACSVIVDPRDDRHWLVTDWYTVWESNDAGETWHTRIAGAQQLVAFTVAASPFDPNVIFYATADSRMYVSADGGRSFVKVEGEGQVCESVNSVAFSPVTPGLALVTGGKFNPCVRVTRDNGRTWKVCAMKGLPPIKPDLGWTKKDGFYAPYAIAVHPKRDEFYLAMGGWTGEGKGGVYRSTDAGETWEWFGQGLGEHHEFFKFQEWGNGKSLAVSESGDLMCWDMGGQNVYRRGSGDAAWTKVAFEMRAKDGASGLAVSPEIKAVPGKPGWFFANCGPDDAVLYRSTDGGRTFAKQWPMTGLFWNLAFDASAPGTMLAVGCGDVFVSRDFGASFSVLPGGFDNPCGHEPTLFMDRGRIWSIGGGSGCWTRPLDEPSEKGCDRSAGNPVKDTLDRYVESGRVAGVVSVLSDADCNVRFDCAGWADLENRRPMTPDTVFAVFSMTKTFTAIALMAAIDEGRISLDDRVEKFLPEFGQVKMADGKPPKRPILVRDVMSHVTGWRGGLGVVDRDIPLREVARRLAATPLSFQPGETFAYGNSWICTGAACLEVATGVPFENYLRKKVLDPLDLRDTTFWPNEDQLKRLVRAYTSDAYPVRPGQDRCTPQLVFPKPGKIHPAASGGLFSTPRDMIRFSQMLAHHGTRKGVRIVSRETFDRYMAVKQTPDAVREPYTVGAWIWGDWLGHEGAMRTDQRANLKTGQSRVFFIQTENVAGPAFFQLKAEWHRACDEVQGTATTVFGT